jgi:phage shock protein C
MKNLTKRTRRLYRSRRERMIAGVCGGLAEYFAIDPTFVRLLFVICVLLGGSAILAYLVLWLVVPLEPSMPDLSNGN